MRNALTTLAVLVLAGLAVPLLADATMSRETPVDPQSKMEIVLVARASHEPHDTLTEMARTLFVGCRLQASSRLEEDGFRHLAEDRYRFVIAPSLNESDRRQLHGCLEDARVQHLQADVLSMREFTR